MIKVGLTGGIASGKTIVAQFFQSLGTPVYFSDDRAKVLMLKNPIKSQLIECLGKEVYNETGELNKVFISNKIFKNQDLLNKINNIVHPVVQEDFSSFCLINKDKKYIIKESAILIELGLIKDLDKIILVTANKEDRINRVSIRDGLNRQEIDLKISKQFEDSKKISFADFIIENNNNNFIIPQLLKIHNTITHL